MFRSISAEMARDGLSAKELAARSGIKYDTLLKKLNGKSEFTRREMLSIQATFSQRLSLDYLFEHSGSHVKAG